MKKSELRQIIKEEIEKIISEIKVKNPSIKKFYSRDYIKQQYPDEVAQIEQDIEDEHPNIWDLYTSLETPEETDDFIQRFRNV